MVRFVHARMIGVMNVLSVMGFDVMLARRWFVLDVNLVGGSVLLHSFVNVHMGNVVAVALYFAVAGLMRLGFRAALRYAFRRSLKIACSGLEGHSHDGFFSSFSSS